MAAGTCEEVENILVKEAHLEKLCEEEWMWETYKDDPVLRMVLALRDGKIREIKDLPKHMFDAFGVVKHKETKLSSKSIRQMHAEAAYFATRYVINAAEEFLEKAVRE